MAATKGQGKVRKAKDEMIGSTSAEKLNNKQYERELKRLHAELVKLQLWTVHKGLKLIFNSWKN